MIYKGLQNYKGRSWRLREIGILSLINYKGHLFFACFFFLFLLFNDLLFWFDFVAIFAFLFSTKKNVRRTKKGGGELHKYEEKQRNTKIGKKMKKNTDAEFLVFRGVASCSLVFCRAAPCFFVLRRVPSCCFLFLCVFSCSVVLLPFSLCFFLFRRAASWFFVFRRVARCFVARASCLVLSSLVPRACIN